ncbi:hypothetical protein NDU88_005859, partial [Pleurodeles waltl]
MEAGFVEQALVGRHKGLRPLYWRARRHTPWPGERRQTKEEGVDCGRFRGGVGSKGSVPDDAATLWEQHPGPLRLQRGKARRHAGGEPTCELHLQRTRVAVIQGGDPWCEEECVLDFDEDSVEEGELVDDREEEDWWAQGGAGPANALSQSFQRSRKVQPAVGKAVDGAHVGRRKAQERPPSLTAGEENASVHRVSVAVEATGDLGNGAVRLVRGIYMSDVGVGTDGASEPEPIKGE